MLKKIYTKWMQNKRKKSFFKNATLDETVFIDYTALCTNELGRKDAIQIGSGSCIRGKIALQEAGKGEPYPTIKIGQHCYLGGGSIIGAVEKITVGENVIIAGDTHIFDNNNHPISPEERRKMSTSGNFFGELWKWKKSEHRPITIEDNVWIGECCSILKGVTIGEGSIVGCRSVVTKDVPPYSVVAGNPARVVKRLKDENDIEKLC